VGVGNGGTLIARVLERVCERLRRRSFIASGAMLGSAFCWAVLGFYRWAFVRTDWAWAQPTDEE
jgi:hypothetical protein